MSATERIRQSPARYIPPWAMTLARGPFGVMGLVEAHRGNWDKARNYFIAGVITDAEGNIARAFDATSKAGAIADPIADGVIRGAGVAAFAPHMNKALMGVTVAAEADCLRMNNTIQRNQENPIVPKGAKWGTVGEGAGAIMLAEGLNRDNLPLRTAGQTLIVAGALTRWVTYRNLYNRAKEADHNIAD